MPAVSPGHLPLIGAYLAHHCNECIHKPARAHTFVVADDYNMMLDPIVNFTNAFLFVLMSRPGWAASGAGLPQSALQLK